jgi:DNA-binding NarL/FixJ family response regulator
MADVRHRIVIIDDDPSFLATVRALLEAEGFDVAGEALNGLDGVAAATELAPDLVLVDVNLPDIDGFEVVARLAEDEGAPPVVLTSIRAANDFGNLVERSRARGFITKADITGEALTGFLGERAAPA